MKTQTRPIPSSTTHPNAFPKVRSYVELNPSHKYQQAVSTHPNLNIVPEIEIDLSGTTLTVLNQSLNNNGLTHSIVHPLQSEVGKENRQMVYPNKFKGLKKSGSSGKLGAGKAKKQQA